MDARFEVTLQPEALADLKGLDSEIHRRVRRKLIWLGNYAEDVRHQPLSEDLTGLYKRRVGNYRIVYELLAQQRRIVVHRIGHRREIYQTL